MRTINRVIYYKAIIYKHLHCTMHDIIMTLLSCCKLVMLGRWTKCNNIIWYQYHRPRGIATKSMIRVLELSVYEETVKYNNIIICQQSANSISSRMIKKSTSCPYIIIIIFCRGIRISCRNKKKKIQILISKMNWNWFIY